LGFSNIFYRFALLSAIYLISCNSFSSETITLRVTHAPPHYFQDINGQWTGSGIETVKAVIIEAGFEPKYLDVPWMRALMMLEHGKLDMMMGLSKTKERSKFLHWIGPIRNETMNLVVRKDNENFQIENLDDIAEIAYAHNKTFGLQLGAFYGEKLATRLQQELFSEAFYTTSSLKQNLGLTSNGRILGFFENKTSIAYRIKHDPEYKQLVLHSFELNKAPVFCGISKKTSPESYQKLQQAFDKLEQNGTLDKIRNKQW